MGDAIEQAGEETRDAAGVVLPTVFAVERDEDEVVARAVMPGRALDGGQVTDEIGVGALGGPARVDEADLVGEAVVAEDEADIGAGDGPGRELVGRAVGVGRAEGLPEDRLVGGEPSNAELVDQRQERRGDRAFRGPHAAWTLTEAALV